MKKANIRPTVLLLGAYSLISWIVFSSTITGKGIGNTLASLTLWIVFLGLGYYLLTNLVTRWGLSPWAGSGCYALGCWGFCQLLSFLRSGNTFNSTLVSGAIFPPHQPLSFVIVTSVAALLLFSLSTNRRTVLTLATMENRLPQSMLKKATTFLKSTGRYCLYRLCICVPVAIFLWVGLTLLRNPSAQSVSYMSLYFCSVPVIGWAVALATILPWVLSLYGVATSIIACTLLGLSYLMADWLITPKFGFSRDFLSPVALVTICTYAILGPALALIAGGVYSGCCGLLSQRRANRYGAHTSSAM